MTPTEFRAIISRLGLSQVRAAQLLGYDGRSGQKWALGERKIPPSVALIFWMLDAGIITLSDIKKVRLSLLFANIPPPC